MDLIDRERALAIMRNQWTLHGMMRAVANMPSAERTARWVRVHDDVQYWYACSECMEKMPLSRYGHEYYSRYCPACGARMEG